MDCSLPGSSVHGIAQVRIPPLGDLPDPGIEPVSPAWQVDSVLLSHLGNPPGNLPAMKTPAVALELPILNNEIFLVTNYPEVIADSFFPSWKMWFVVVKMLLTEANALRYVACVVRSGTVTFMWWLLLHINLDRLKMYIDWFCFLFIFFWSTLLLLSILRSKQARKTWRQ